MAALTSPAKEACRYVSTFRDPTQTYLESPWTLWLINKPSTPNRSWLHFIHPIATFSTIQQFWGMYNTLKPPSELPAYWKYALFRGGLGRRIIVPDWEDHENIGGGCMQITGFSLETKTIDHLWRDICLKVIEEAWIHTSDYINGVLVSTKTGTTRYYVWVAACKEHIWETVRDRIEGVFAQDCRTPLKWTPHTERKTTMDHKIAAKRRLSRPPSLTVAKRPRKFRSRSMGYRADKLDVKTDVFLLAKRKLMLQGLKPTYAKKHMTLMAVKESASHFMMDRGDSAGSAVQPFICGHRRGRSCHGMYGLGELPVYNQARGDHGRCTGKGELNVHGVRFCCPAHQLGYVGKASNKVTDPSREMVDASTQFSAKTGNMDMGAGDMGGGSLH